jgi:hypothetical protein
MAPAPSGPGAGAIVLHDRAGLSGPEQLRCYRLAVWSTATPKAEMEPVMKLCCTFVPSSLARPIVSACGAFGLLMRWLAQ